MKDNCNVFKQKQTKSLNLSGIESVIDLKGIYERLIYCHLYLLQVFLAAVGDELCL